jgi:hypothetical protein
MIGFADVEGGRASSEVVQNSNECAGQKLTFARRQRCEQFVLDLGQQGVEPPQLFPACSGDRDDVTAPVGLIFVSQDQILSGELADHCRDIAAI